MDNSQDEEAEAVGKLSPNLLWPDKTNLIFFFFFFFFFFLIKCVGIRVSDYRSIQ